MTQGTYGELRTWEDFTFGDIGITADAIADTAPEWVGQVSIGGNDTALTLLATVDEPGGVLSIDVTDNTADDGLAVYAAPVVPADGGAIFEVRCKVNDISATNFYMGFMESLTPTDPDQGEPFTMATTTITVVNLGVTAFVFVDHNATNEDWHFAAAQDAAGAAGVDLTDPGIFAGRAGADLSGATGDDQWIIFRVEIEPDGTAFGYVGSSHIDADAPEGLQLIGQTERGALDATALVFPVLMMNNNGGTGITGELDYFSVRTGRDWTV